MITLLLYQNRRPGPYVCVVVYRWQSVLHDNRQVCQLIIRRNQFYARWPQLINTNCCTQIYIATCTKHLDKAI